MAGVQRTVDVNVAPEDFFKVVADFNGYTEFIPEMKRVKVGARSGNTVEATFTIEVDAGITKKEISYTLRFLENPPKGVTWSMVRGDMMKSNDGSWTIAEAGPGRTRAVYSIDIGFGMLVPKSVSNLLQERGLPKLMEQFKTRAESLYGKK